MPIDWSSSRLRLKRATLGPDHPDTLASLGNLALGYHAAGKLDQEAMVLTVEPGCYIRPADNVPKAFWNIGVRIEDDVLVTAKGREVLTADCPKKVKEVEDAVLDR